MTVDDDDDDSKAFRSSHPPPVVDSAAERSDSKDFVECRCRQRPTDPAPTDDDSSQQSTTSSHHSKSSSPQEVVTENTEKNGGDLYDVRAQPENNCLILKPDARSAIDANSSSKHPKDGDSDDYLGKILQPAHHVIRTKAGANHA